MSEEDVGAAEERGRSSWGLIERHGPDACGVWGFGGVLDHGGG